MSINVQANMKTNMKTNVKTNMKTNMKKVICLLSFVSLMIATPIVTTIGYANEYDQAQRIWSRITGSQANSMELEIYAEMIRNNNAQGVAEEAMNELGFYWVTVKNLATPWTNREFSIQEPLNDYSATVIGMVRDDVPFNQIMYKNLIYISNADGYSHIDNAAYEVLEENFDDLRDPGVLIGRAQSSLEQTQLTPESAAGVLTTRQAGKAFYEAGTNRAVWRYMSTAHLCRDLEDLKDITLPAERVRLDISRNPGGKSVSYLNDCVGCHSGMDAINGALAYYDWDEESERLTYAHGEVRPKFLKSMGGYHGGFVTTDDSWVNHWRTGQHSLLGWSSELPGRGHGAKSLGQEIAYSKAFAECKSEQVFKQICLRAPETVEDVTFVDQMTAAFVENGEYNLKRLYAMAAVECMGE